MPRYQRAKLAGGTFFFTVAIADRGDDLLVREIGRLRYAYRLIQLRRPFETIAICILPDHLHAIWSLPENDSDFSRRWSLIKSSFSRALPAASSRTARHIEKREKGLWRRRYWEHVIRNENDLQRHIDYIHFNPVKHELVSRVVDWPHSSFQQYVAREELPADWGGDAREIAGSFGE